MAKTKYIATHDSVIVGRRASDRTYTHAIVVQRIEEYARKQAYEYIATETDKSNYRYYCAIAEGRSQFTHIADEVVAASVKVDGGFDAYIARVRDQAIARFEANKAKGHFEPFVASWAGRPDLAQKVVPQHTGVSCKLVAIVKAEVA